MSSHVAVLRSQSYKHFQMPATVCAFRRLNAILACGAVLVLASCVSLHPGKNADAHFRQRTLMDADWRFQRGDIASSNEVITPGYDDADWQQVRLPHDYQLDGEYEAELVRPAKVSDSRRRGYLPVEVGWYRKHFFIPRSDRGKMLQLEFGGIFRDSQVWLNGQYLGSHLDGYTGFNFDVTKTIRY